MKSHTVYLAHQTADLAFTAEEQALEACEKSRTFEDIGQYEAAGECLDFWWPRVGEMPAVADLQPATAAEVTLRVGTLTGWLGGAHQIGGAQETAKNILTEALIAWGNLGNLLKVAETEIELSWCYFREGAFDEARVNLQSALAKLSDRDVDLKLLALVRCATVERNRTRLDAAQQLLEQATIFVDRSGNLSLKGRYHFECATTQKSIGASEKKPELFDQALFDFAAAGFYFEECGHLRYNGFVENNTGSLLLSIERREEAIEHLTRARDIFTRLRDIGSIAQVDETLAQAYLALDCLDHAENAIRHSLCTLEQGGQVALLTLALTTYGQVLARLNRPEQAQKALERAARIGEPAGDIEGAGRALLTLLEEVKTLTRAQAIEAYTRAETLLGDTQHQETIARLLECARRLFGLDSLIGGGATGGAAAPAPSHAFSAERESPSARPLAFPDVEVSPGVQVEYIYHPSTPDYWFAYIEGRSVFNRADLFIGWADEDGQVLREPGTNRVFATLCAGIYRDPQGGKWGVVKK